MNEEEKKEVKLNKNFNWDDIITIVCCIVVILLNVVLITNAIITKEVKVVDYVMSCSCCICWCFTALIFERALTRKR